MAVPVEQHSPCCISQSSDLYTSRSGTLCCTCVIRNAVYIVVFVQEVKHSMAFGSSKMLGNGWTKESWSIKSFFVGGLY
jgi:hypothetical protein